MDSISGKTHPLMMVAAISVTAAALAAIGVMTGLIPGRHTEAPASAAVPAVTTALAPGNAVMPVPSAPAPTQVAISEPSPAPAAAVPAETVDKVEKPAARPARVTTARKVSTHDSSQRQPPPPPATATTESAPVGTPTPVAPPVCHECGTIESVREVVQKGEGTGLGAVAGGVLGGVLGHQVGSGRGRDLATVAGAVGGAVAGHEVEKRQRKNIHYEISVRMDDGALRTVDSTSQPTWHGGERVKVVDGAVVPMM